jgi:hypothetical protein
MCATDMKAGGHMQGVPDRRDARPLQPGAEVRGDRSLAKPVPSRRAML